MKCKRILGDAFFSGRSLDLQLRYVPGLTRAEELVVIDSLTPLFWHQNA